MQLDYAIEGYWLAKRRDFSTCSNCPWLNPAAGQVVQGCAVYTGFVSASASFAVVDNGINPPSPRPIIGVPTQNYFWVVRSNSDGISTNSNRTGEFDFRPCRGTERDEGGRKARPR
jgi:hypothetical protein